MRKQEGLTGVVESYIHSNLKKSLDRDIIHVCKYLFTLKKPISLLVLMFSSGLLIGLLLCVTAGMYVSTVEPAFKVVRIQGMSAYSVRCAGPHSCVCNCD